MGEKESRVEHRTWNREFCSRRRRLGEEGNPKNLDLRTLARQKLLRLSISHLPSSSSKTARVVEWQTRTFEGRMPKGMRVQVPPRAPQFYAQWPISAGDKRPEKGCKQMTCSLTPPDRKLGLRRRLPFAPAKEADHRAKCVAPSFSPSTSQREEKVELLRRDQQIQ
jgi:hypothetical protein